MRSLLAFVLLGLTALHGRAQLPPPKQELPQRNLDSTLNHYLTASGHVLVGEVISEPVKQDKLFQYQNKDPRTIHSCRVRILESLHDKIGPKGHELTVVVVRWADAQEKSPAGVKKGERYIFFLNWNYGTLGPHTADPWFGVQPYNAKMVELLRKMGNRPFDR